MEVMIYFIVLRSIIIPFFQCSLVHVYQFKFQINAIEFHIYCENILFLHFMSNFLDGTNKVSEFEYERKRKDVDNLC